MIFPTGFGAQKQVDVWAKGEELEVGKWKRSELSTVAETSENWDSTSGVRCGIRDVQY